MSDTTVWISGATDGIRGGLAKTVPWAGPWAGARITNLSRRDHPDFETVKFDFTKPGTYPSVEQSFRKQLASFKGKRAIFFHNALETVEPK